jgi:hypothetical protein
MTKPLRLTTLEPTEAQTQAAILQYLTMDPRVAWARRFNTGAAVVEGVGPGGRPSRRFVRYAFPGCADILGQLRGSGRFLAIEVKAPKGRATQEQTDFLQQVIDGGGVAVIARSIEDVRDALDSESTSTTQIKN